MIMVRLLMSVGSWLVCRVAEKATRPVPERTDIPRALPDGSEEGVESHTTRHFPSRTMGSVSFWPREPGGAPSRSRSRRGATLRSLLSSTRCWETELLGFMLRIWIWCSVLDLQSASGAEDPRTGCCRT